MSGVVLTDNDMAVENLWSIGTRYSVDVYLSGSKRLDVKSTAPVVSISNLTYCEATEEQEFSLNITCSAAGDYTKENVDEMGGDVKLISPAMWKGLCTTNMPLYLHILVVRQAENVDDEKAEGMHYYYSPKYVLHEFLKLTRINPRPPYSPPRFLLSDPWNAGAEEGRLNYEALSKQINYWKPQACLRIVVDSTRYLPPYAVGNIFALDSENRLTTDHSSICRLVYTPPIHMDETGLTSDMYMPINDSVHYLPLHISIGSTSMPHWQLLRRLDKSMTYLEDTLGSQKRDTDELRRLITDTKVSTLLLTLIASSLHMLFEFLAFKSDVDFWKKNKSILGLSIRAIGADLVFQFIVLLYLVDDDASFLISVPSFIGLVIQGWKLHRATGMKLFRCNESWFGWQLKLTRLEEVAAAASVAKDQDDDLQATVAVTMECDRQAVAYLCMLLLPLVFGFSIKSLIRDMHTNWYSWGIKSLTSVVYTLGFVLMTPQLFINHRLKSVSHLPWQFLCYRFTTTFIDDLFAFLMDMPVLHRIACLRGNRHFAQLLFARFLSLLLSITTYYWIRYLFPVNELIIVMVCR